MHASTSTSFNLDFIIHNPTLLTIYDSESFGSTVGFCMFYSCALDTPLTQIVLESAVRRAARNIHNMSGLVRYGATYLVRNGTGRS